MATSEKRPPPLGPPPTRRPQAKWPPPARPPRRRANGPPGSQRRSCAARCAGTGAGPPAPRNPEVERSKLNDRRGKPQVLAHVSTFQPILEFRFLEQPWWGLCYGVLSLPKRLEDLRALSQSTHNLELQAQLHAKCNQPLSTSEGSLFFAGAVPTSQTKSATSRASIHSWPFTSSGFWAPRRKRSAASSASAVKGAQASETGAYRGGKA